MAGHRRPARRRPTRLILDSGAVIGLARHDHRALAVLQAAREAGAMVFIPSVVLAETIRGGPADAGVHRAMKVIDEVIVADAKVGRRAGQLLGAARSNSTLDALVVASALTIGGGAILTSDPVDLARPASDGAVVVLAL